MSDDISLYCSFATRCEKRGHERSNGCLEEVFHDTLKENTSKNMPTHEPKDAMSHETMLTFLQQQSVKDFCHANESSTIDSNSCCKTVEVRNGEKHVPRAWIAKTCNKQCELFKQSEVSEQLKNT